LAKYNSIFLFNLPNKEEGGREEKTANAGRSGGINKSVPFIFYPFVYY
jgi:hypothetical protein